MGNMGNKVSRKYDNLQVGSNTQGVFRTGELDVFEKQALTGLDHKDQVMDKHLDDICSNLDTLSSKLELVSHEIQVQTTIVTKVRLQRFLFDVFTQAFLYCM